MEPILMTNSMPMLSFSSAVMIQPAQHNGGLALGMPPLYRNIGFLAITNLTIFLLESLSIEGNAVNLRSNSINVESLKRQAALSFRAKPKG
ncbi:MAG: hypothetical protein IKH57_09160 [Clostridia bacterium]|nr:hypothetical protein [Clostridia bacterium]